MEVACRFARPVETLVFIDGSHGGAPPVIEALERDAPGTAGIVSRAAHLDHGSWLGYRVPLIGPSEYTIRIRDSRQVATDYPIFVAPRRVTEIRHWPARPMLVQGTVTIDGMPAAGGVMTVAGAGVHADLPVSTIGRFDWTCPGRGEFRFSYLGGPEETLLVTGSLAHEFAYRTATIRVGVQDERGVPVASVPVALHGRDRRSFPNETTDARGTAQFARLLPNHYTVELPVEGTQRWWTATEKVSVLADGGEVDIAFTVIPRLSRSVRVTNWNGETIQVSQSLTGHPGKPRIQLGSFATPVFEVLACDGAGWLIGQGDDCLVVPSATDGAP
ncbi:MAG: hypothetical protein L0206_18200, partial [Actinobacteria bacterium]|nr:hypothetical protein [Actinomycetota bacterium]